MLRSTWLALGLLLGAGAAQAETLTWYADRNSFNAAQPGLKQQSFDSANLYGQPYVYQASPLTAKTNDAVFATGNILPATVKTVMVDINPAVVTKVADRGTTQAAGLVTDAELFLRELAEALR